MGQYYLICCPELKEYLDPNDFGEGLKLMEFGCGGMGTMTGLAMLLADGCGRGGGDLQVPDKGSYKNYIGRWKNKRIVIAGDYADMAPKRQRIFKSTKETYDKIMNNFYWIASKTYRNISLQVIMCLLQDECIKDKWIKTYTDHPYIFDCSKYKYEIVMVLGKVKEVKDEIKNKSRKPQNRKKQSRV